MKPSLPLPEGRLRPASENDLDRLLALLHDNEVRRYLCDDTLIPRETVAAMLARSSELDARGLGLWAIEQARFARIAGLRPVSKEVAAAPAMENGIEPIIALDPIYWGRGLAQAALSALVRHACESCGLARLVAAVDAPNARSHRLMRACGFAATGTTPGPAHELVLYDLRLKDPETPG